MRIFLAILMLGFTGCGSPSEPDDRWAVPENIDYAMSLGIDLAAMNRTDSGLYWQDVVVGEGRAVVLDDEIRFHLRIWLPDGRSVESTYGGAPLQQKVLLLIPGLAEGVTGMRPTGVRKLVIKPELAWPNGKKPIPPRTTIVSEVELVAIQP